MKKSITFLVILLSTSIFAQQKEITGNVTDLKGEILLGVTVHIKNSSRGTVTDFDGNYFIKANPNDILVFSSVGFETKETPIDNQTTVNIQLIPSSTELDEIVVIGYGTVKKSDLTGAVSTVKAAEIEKIGAIGLEQALSGRAAGVVVSQASGQLGSSASIVVRGLSSLNSSEPLYVIDGVPMDNTATAGLGDQDLESSTISPMSLINPSDIQSIEILKDASSTAVYGSRGANGVILITTKSGQSGKGVITIDHDYSIIDVPNMIDLLDANEYTILNNEAKVNNGGSESNSTKLDSARLGLLPSTNYQETIFRTGTSSNTNINFSGGNKEMRYLISTNILSAKGIVELTDLDRITNRIKLDANVTDKFKVGTSISYAHVTSNQKAINTGENSNKGASSAIKRALNALPYEKFVEDPDSETLDGWSPLTNLRANEFTNLLTQLMGNINLSYKFNKKYSFKTALTHQNRNTAKRYYQYDILGRFSEGGRAKTSDSRNTRSTITNTLNYKGKFGKHKFNAFIGQSLELTEYESITTSAFGFNNDILTYFAPETATFQNPNSVDYYKTTLSSWFGRIGYDYKSKILATLTGRYEGSSKFSEHNKWAFFPAAAVAYKISKEDFMQSLHAVNELKLRASYGFSGNQSLKPYQSLETYTAGQTGFGEVANTYYSLTQLPNENLTWETTSQLNFAIDYGILKDRISGSFEYYIKQTDDLLFADNAIAAQSGFSTYTENFGSLETKGFEMDLSARIIAKKNFTWTLNGNLSFGKTKITDMASDYIHSGWDPGYIAGGTQRLIIGEEVGAFYGYETAGIAQFDDFVEFQGLTHQERVDLYNAEPEKGDYTFVDGFDKVTYETGRQRPGEQLYSDLDNSKTFNEADRKVIGRAQPDVSFGINNTFTYGDIDFSFFIDSQLGKDIAAIQNIRLLEFASRQALAITTERWTPDNPSAVFPRSDSNNQGTSIFHSRFIEDGSFVRLQNVTIGYTIPQFIAESMHISSLKIFVSGSNLYTWTNYTGYTPDVSLRGSATRAIGHDSSTYPQGRTIRMGIKLRF